MGKEERGILELVRDLEVVENFLVAYAHVAEVVETGLLEQHVHVLETGAEHDIVSRLLFELCVCRHKRVELLLVILARYEHLELPLRHRQGYVSDIFILLVEHLQNLLGACYFRSDAQLFPDNLDLLGKSSPLCLRQLEVLVSAVQQYVALQKGKLQTVLLALPQNPSPHLE